MTGGMTMPEIDRIETMSADIPESLFRDEMICFSCEGLSHDGPFCRRCIERSTDLIEELDDLGVGD